MAYDKKYAPKDYVDLTDDGDCDESHIPLDERYPDSQEGAGRYSSEAPAPSTPQLYESGDGTQPENLEPPPTPDSKGNPVPSCVNRVSCYLTFALCI